MGTCYTVFLEYQHPKASGWQCVAQFDLGKAYELHRHVPTVRLYDLIGPANRNASAPALEALRFEPNHIGCLEGLLAIQTALLATWNELYRDREANRGSPLYLQCRAIQVVAEAIVEAPNTVRLILVGS